MSDPLRFDGSRALDAAPDVDRDAKIEQLLLVGLDHYFAAQYEQAINVWTRALFLDRNHARARAYIERARSALAERQRQSEELLQTGLAAFRRGDSDEARRLLQAAIDGGAPAEEALALLARLDGLDGVEAKPTRVVRSRPASPASNDEAVSFRFRWMLTAASLVIVALAGVLGFAYWNRADWRSTGSLIPAAPAVASPSRDAGLPLPRRSDVALARATTLAAGGHLRDALAVLDTIRATDPQRIAADRLRAEIQRQLLALAAATRPTRAPRDKAADRVP
jgi:tetratricopeptide (TPR) repeat protein